MKEKDKVKNLAKLMPQVANNPEEDIEYEDEEAAIREESRYFSPLVLTLAAKYKVSEPELENLKGTGPDGKITRDDLLRYIDGRDSNGAHPQSELPSKSENFNLSPGKSIYNPDLASSTEQLFSKEESFGIAKSQCHLIQEVDVSSMVTWRAQHKDAFYKKYGYRLGLTACFLEVIVQTLYKFPSLWKSPRMPSEKDLHFGCSIVVEEKDQPFSSITPVFQGIRGMKCAEFARLINEFRKKCSAKTLLPSDLLEVAFTVINPGRFGTTMGFITLKERQSAALCIGAIKKGPAVTNTQGKARDLCSLTLSYNSAINDEATAASFLAEVASSLEKWETAKSVGI